MQKIRLLITEPAPGPWNMAVDETLSQNLQQKRDGFFAFLRFYRWKPPTLSFGYNQPVTKLVKLTAVENNGYGIVKNGLMAYYAGKGRRLFEN